MGKEKYLSIFFFVFVFSNFFSFVFVKESEPTLPEKTFFQKVDENFWKPTKSRAQSFWNATSKNVVEPAKEKVGRPALRFSRDKIGKPVLGLAKKGFEGVKANPVVSGLVTATTILAVTALYFACAGAKESKRCKFFARLGPCEAFASGSRAADLQHEVEALKIKLEKANVALAEATPLPDDDQDGFSEGKEINKLQKVLEAKNGLQKEVARLSSQVDDLKIKLEKANVALAEATPLSDDDQDGFSEGVEGNKKIKVVAFKGDAEASASGSCVADLQQANSHLHEEVDSLQLSLQNEQNKLEQLQKKHAEESESLQSKVDQYKSSAWNNLCAEIAKQKNEINKLQEVLEAKNGLQKEVGGLLSQVDDLNIKLAKVKTDNEKGMTDLIVSLEEKARAELLDREECSRDLFLNNCDARMRLEKNLRAQVRHLEEQLAAKVAITKTPDKGRPRSNSCPSSPTRDVFEAAKPPVEGRFTLFRNPNGS